METTIDTEQNPLLPHVRVLRAMCAYYGIGQKQLALIAGCSEGTVSYVFNERQDRITRTILLDLQNAFLTVENERRKALLPIKERDDYVEETEIGLKGLLIIKNTIL